MAHAFICYHKTHYIFSPLITFDSKPRMSFYSWALRKANECDRGTKRYFCSSNCEHGELIEIQPSAKHIITDCLRRSKHHSNQFITVAGVSHNQTRAPSWRIDLRWFFFQFSLSSSSAKTITYYWYDFATLRLMVLVPIVSTFSIWSVRSVSSPNNNWKCTRARADARRFDCCQLRL